VIRAFGYASARMRQSALQPKTADEMGTAIRASPLRCHNSHGDFCHERTAAQHKLAHIGYGEPCECCGGDVASIAEACYHGARPEHGGNGRGGKIHLGSCWSSC
jgi:hypothetical protein